MNILLDLFLTFLKIGAFTFGGGYAMISVIENACVEKKQWITHDDMMNITVIAESTPGPVAINCATFVGYKKKGVIGALVATLGVILPSFVIIFLIAKVLDNFLEYRWIAAAFKGIKLAVGVLILDVGIRMIKQIVSGQTGMKYVQLVLMILSALTMLAINVFALEISSIIVMLACGAVNMVIFLIWGRKQEVTEGKSENAGKIENKGKAGDEK